MDVYFNLNFIFTEIILYFYCLQLFLLDFLCCKFLSFRSFFKSHASGTEIFTSVQINIRPPPEIILIRNSFYRFRFLIFFVPSVVPLFLWSYLEHHFFLIDFISFYFIVFPFYLIVIFFDLFLHVRNWLRLIFILMTDLNK